MIGFNANLNDEKEISLEKDSYAYTGRQVCPEIDVKWNGTILEKDKFSTSKF